MPPNEAMPTKPKTNALRECDLYAPLHDYLCAQGYTVRSEVRGCDITATRAGEDGNDELVVVEMKRGLTIDLLIQATQRQRVADSVYVAVPRPNKRRTREDNARWRGLQHLLKRLELGLILVQTETDLPPSVEVVFHPVRHDQRRSPVMRRAILKEIAGRSGDYNQGGMTKRPIITAYREKAIHIACCLHRLGPLTPAALRALGTDERTQNILYKNVYGWFEHQGHGLYALGGDGQTALLSAYPDLVAHHQRQVLLAEGRAAYAAAGGEEIPVSPPPAAAA